MNEEWYCLNCNRMYEEHIKKGTPDEDADEKDVASDDWCYSYKEYKFIEDIESRRTKRNSAFLPVDNLTQIELTAKEKGILQ